MAIYMIFKGKVQGTIQGDVTATGFINQIGVNSVQLGMGQASSTSSGLVSGRQVVRPLVFTKKVDKSSPLLINSCITNEVATSVTFNYVVEGSTHAAFLTVQLTNAIIQDFNEVAHDDGSSTETITLSFQKCEYTWVTGGITASYDMTTQG